MDAKVVYTLAFIFGFLCLHCFREFFSVQRLGSHSGRIRERAPQGVTRSVASSPAAASDPLWKMAVTGMLSQHRMATVPLTRSLPLLSRLRDDGGLNYLRTSCYFRARPAFYFSSSRSEYGMSDVPFYRETGNIPLGSHQNRVLEPPKTL